MFKEAVLLIDTHCHIDLYRNPNIIADNIEKEKIITIAVTNLPSYFQLSLKHLKNYKYIRVALGLHPLYAEKHTLLELKKFNEFIYKTSYIGEVGLDFSAEGISNKAKQINSFKHVLSHINDRPRVISIHSRKAEQVVLQMLNDFSIKNSIFHWYSGSLTVLNEILLEGHYFSVNPAMLKSMTGRKIINSIPPNRLLTETDGPFVKINNKPIQFMNIRLVYDYLSSIWNMCHEEVEIQIKKNFRSILLPIKEYSKNNYLL